MSAIGTVGAVGAIGVIGCAAVGGGVGAAGRYAVDEWVTGRWRRDFPLGIVVVNVTGSLVLGLLVGVLVSDRAGSAVYALVGTGVLGGYTTFSTTSLDAVRLARSGRIGSALGYAVGTMLATVAAAMLGMWIGGA